MKNYLEFEKEIKTLEEEMELPLKTQAMKVCPKSILLK